MRVVNKVEVIGEVIRVMNEDTMAVVSEGIYQEKGGLAWIGATEDVTPDTGEWLVDTVESSHPGVGQGPADTDPFRTFPSELR